MRVLLISASSGSRGGGEFYFQMLASGLCELGHHVAIMLSDGTHMDEFAASMAGICDVIRIPYTNTYHRTTRVLGALLDSGCVRRIQRLLDQMDVDVVHLNKQNLEDGLDLLLAISRCRHPSLATIHVTRSMQSLGAAAGRLRDRLSQAAIRRCQVPLIGTSATCTRDLQSLFPDRLQVPVYNVANGAFPVDVAQRSRVCSEWGMQDDDLVLGTVARLEAQKNPLFVCQLLAALPQQVHLVWVGDGSLRESLSREAVRLGVANRLHLDGWQADGRNRMSGFDVFVLPSLYEGFPFATLEAKSASLPCVISQVDGTQDAIHHGLDGYLCPVNDVDAWLSALTPLVESAELRRQMGQAARERYEREFSLEAMARRTVAVYEDVVRGRGE